MNPFTPETSAVHAWLGSLLTNETGPDRPVRDEFRTLASAEKPTFLAAAMRQYVSGAVDRGEIDPRSAEQADYEAIATRFRELGERYGRAPVAGLTALVREVGT